MTIRFSGFRSRWTIPAACAAARASASWSARSIASRTDQSGVGKQLPQGAAAHELHRDVRELALFADSVDRDDVRVVEGGGEPGFLLEPPQIGGPAGGRARKHLERDLAAKREVPCAIDLAHPARALERQDLVPVDVAFSEVQRRFLREVPRLLLERRPLQECAGSFGVGQQRPHLPQERLVPAAGLLEIRLALAISELERVVEDPFDLGPAVRRHVTRRRARAGAMPWPVSSPAGSSRARP